MKSADAAQARRHRFYDSRGFVNVGKTYIEDGIDHMEMVCQNPGVAT